jgi:hypothetical protein
VLDNSAADKSIRGIGGRTVSVSLRGLAEVGRLCGEGPMSLGLLERKENNAGGFRRPYTPRGYFMANNSL